MPGGGRGRCLSLLSVMSEDETGGSGESQPGRFAGRRKAVVGAVLLVVLAAVLVYGLFTGRVVASCSGENEQLRVFREYAGDGTREYCDRPPYMRHSRDVGPEDSLYL